jgi:hypothetical protein
VSEVLRHKALRLPLILVGLMVMVWVIQTFRPHITPPTQTNTYRDSSSVKVLEASDLPVSTTTTAPRLSLSFQKPSTWTLRDIAAITKQGSKTVLVFTDDSTRDVTPALLEQLPSFLQTRVSYDQAH